MGHVSSLHTFAKSESFQHFSQEETQAMMDSIVRGPQAEPVERADAVSAAQVLEVMAQIVDAVKSMPVPQVVVNPTLGLPDVTEIREQEIIREPETNPKTAAGPKITGTRTTIRRIPKE